MGVGGGAGLAGHSAGEAAFGTTLAAVTFTSFAFAKMSFSFLNLLLQKHVVSCVYRETPHHRRVFQSLITVKHSGNARSKLTIQQPTIELVREDDRQNCLKLDSVKGRISDKLVILRVRQR